MNYFTLLAERRVECPQGYAPNTTTPPHWSYCYRPGRPAPRSSCSPTVGNPIDPLSTAKIQAETDFQAASASVLKFVRYYHSHGHAQRDAAQPQHPLGNYWRSNFDRSISVVTGDYQQVAYVDRPEGYNLLFKGTGGNWQASTDSPERLQYLNDIGGGVPGWRLLTANNEIETYDASGRLKSIHGAGGEIQTLTYSDGATDPAIAPRPGMLIRVADAFGRHMDLTYDQRGQLATLTSPDGATVRYGFDVPAVVTDPPRLTSVTFPDPSTRSYLYGEPSYVTGSGYNLLTGIVDENASRFATFTFVANANSNTAEAKTTEHAGGVGRHSLNYTSPSFTRDTDALGTQRSYNYATVAGVRRLAGVSQPGGSGCGAASSAISYDSVGNVASRTDFDGHKTCYANDLTRNLETKRVEGLLASADCTTSLATPPAPTTANPVRTISTQWHPDWRLETKRAEPKKLTTWVYNGQPDPFASNAIASCAPSTALLPDGKPIAVLCKKVEQATTDATGASGFAATLTGNPRVSTWTYNGFGQVLTANGPRTDVNDTTAYSYYPSTDFSNPAAGHTLGDLWKVTNPAGHVTEYLNYDKNGRLLKMKDPNGVITTMTYSPRGWLKTRQVGSELTTYDYDAVGQLKKVTAPDGSWIGFDYDPAHRLVATYDNRNNRIAYTLDNAGNRTKEEVTDPAGYLVRTQTRVYDALSRLQNVIQPQ